MADTNEQIATGSKLAVLVTMDGLPESMEFTDDDVDITLHFYVYGKRSTKEFDVPKSALVKSTTSTKIFYALVDTTDMPTGDLMCEAEVEYPYSLVDDNVLDKPTFDCGVTLIQNT